MAFEQLSNSAVTTLDGAITNVATTLTVTSAVGFPTSGNFRVRIDAEILLVTGVASLVFTVTRGAEGTGNVAHDDNARIAHVLTAGAIQTLRDEDVVILNDGRLTVVTGDAEGLASNQSTIYFTPYIGGKISLYDGTRWLPHDFTEVSVAVPSTIFRAFDVFVFDNSGTITIETQNWSENTAAITAASNATPIVITSVAHGLADGDFVGIRSIVGNTAANDLIWEVANKADDTFELLGSSGNGAYISGGTWYECSGQTNSGISLQDKISVDSGDTTKRYLGTGFTGPTSGQITVNATICELVNVDNQILHFLSQTDSTSHTYTSTTFRPWNNDGSFHTHFITPINRTSPYKGIVNSVLRGDATAFAKIGLGKNSLSGGAVEGTIGTTVSTNIQITGMIFENPIEGFNLFGVVEARLVSGTATYDEILMQLTILQ